MNTEYTNNEDICGETDTVGTSIPYSSPFLESAVEVAAEAGEAAAAEEVAAAPEVASAAAAAAAELATTVSPGCR